MAAQSMNIDAKEADRLCDELRACIDLGPGVVDARSAGKLRAIIATLRREDIGPDALGKLAEIERNFARWFSVRKWKEGTDDNGDRCKGFLQADIQVMRGCIGRRLNSSSLRSGA